MGTKTKMQMLEVGVAYAKKCAELEEKLNIDLWLRKSELRIETFKISLQRLSTCENAQEASGYLEEADSSLEELTGDKYLDGAILCEGDVYEALYCYEGYGDTSIYGKRKTRKIEDELESVLNNYGFSIDLSRPGTILLQCQESFEEQMNDRKRRDSHEHLCDE